MKFTAKQIAEMLDGSVEGNPNQSVSDLSAIESGKPGTLTFLANPAYVEYIYSTKASVAIVSSTFKPEKDFPSELTLIKVTDPRLAFSKLMEAYGQMLKKAPGVHPSAVVDESVVLTESTYIGPFVVIEDGVKIGNNVQIGAHSFIGRGSEIGKEAIIHERVHIGNRTKIGKSAIIQPGVIIGGDGFGFAPNSENEYQKVVHLGNVIIEDHVEIGAGTSIDRGTIGSTIVRKGVKLDNLIQIAHNVEIGENTVIAAQTGVAGSTKIGKNCMIGGQVGIIGHISIADDVKIAAQSGIGGSIKTKGQVVQGSPAMPIGDFKRAYVHFRKLDQMAENIDRLSASPSKRSNNG
ncbi:MAG: UDP-3-O-(3-hydroxymyristoyl)glucosamine N-acyltransferase [Salibacteraceae bacterium]